MQTMTTNTGGSPERVHRWLTFSPGATDRLKLTALVAMLADHANTLLLAHPQPELYALGRTAFPLFVLIWAHNVMLNPQRLQIRANRLWIWALATQPVFSFAFRGHDPWYALNILFVFAGATQLLAWHHRWHTAGALAGAALLSLLAWPLSIASYGIPGLVLALSLALFLHASAGLFRSMAGCIALSALVILNGHHLIQLPATVAVFAILPTVVLPAVTIGMATSPAAGGTNRFMPAQFFYCAYGGHLLILGFIRLVMAG